MESFHVGNNTLLFFLKIMTSNSLPLDNIMWPPHSYHISYNKNILFF